MLLPMMTAVAQAAGPSAPTAPSAPAAPNVGSSGSQTTSSSASTSRSIDLSSTTASVTAHHSGTITVGGALDSIHAGQAITPAEAAALAQVVHTGTQQLILGALGNATGGLFNVTAATAHGIVNNIVIPSGVTVLDNVSKGAVLNLTGNLTNSGSFYLYSTNPLSTTASISAQNIFNQSGGILSTALPANNTFALGSTLASLNLNLFALNNIVNAGLIHSSGNLSLTAGNAIINAQPYAVGSNAPVMSAAQNINLVSNQITNAGLINAINGNLNINGFTNGSINVNNINGTLQALLGNINVRDNSFTAKSDFTLNGGSVLSNQFNVFSGNGTADITADVISGLLNINAGVAHTVVNSGSLNLGTLNLSGDPTFYNTNGAITINNSINLSGANSDLAIVAQTDITTSAPNITITTSGGQINMIAGAGFTIPNGSGSSTTIPPGTPDTLHTLTVTGPSGLGGKIDLATNPILSLDSSSATGNGGNINLIAYANAANTSGGTISLPANVTIKSSGGVGTGITNGNVTIIGGSYTGNAVSIGSVNATGSGAGNGGTVTVAAAVPTFSSIAGVSIVNGKITAGSFIPGTATTGSVITGDINADTDINITGQTTTTNNLTAGHNISVTAASDVFNSSGALQQAALTSKGAIQATNNITLTTTHNGTITLNGNVSAGTAVNMTANGTGSIITPNQVIADPGVGKYAFGAAVTPNGQFAYVPNNADNTVSVINTATNTVVATIALTGSPVSETSPKGAVVSPDGSSLYVVCQGTTTGQGVVVVIDTSTQAVKTAYTISSSGGTAANFDPQTIAVAPNGMIYVLSDYAGGLSGSATSPSQVTVINPANPTNQVNITLPGGFGKASNLGGIVVNPQGTLAYVANSGSNNISVINLSTNTVSQTISLSQFVQTGFSPNPVALNFNPNGTRLYVGESDGNFNASQGQIITIDTTQSSTTFNKVLSTASQVYGGGFLPQGIATSATGTQLFVNPTYVGDGQAKGWTNELEVVMNPISLSLVDLPNVGTNKAPDGYGSSTFTTVVTNQLPITGTSVRNTQAYIADPTHGDGLGGFLNGSVSVIQTPTIQAHTINLSSGSGNIQVNYDAQGGTFTANTGGAGSVVAGNVGTVASSVGASSAGTNAGTIFQLGSTSSLNITGPISASIVSIQTTANNGSITFGGSIGRAGATSVDIEANGSGSITQSLASANLIGQSVTLVSGSGNILSTAGSSNAIQTTASQLTLQTSGTATVNNASTALTLGAGGAGGNLSVSNTGSISIGSINVSGPASGGSGGSVTLNGSSVLFSTGSSILANAVGSGNGGTINVTASALSGTGNLLLDADGTGVGNGGSVTMSIGGAYSVGTGSGAVQVSAMGGTTSGDGGSVILRSGSNLTVNTAQITKNVRGTDGNGGTYELSAGYNTGAGVLNVTGSVNANGVGSGVGGVIKLLSGSSAPFTVDSETLFNGVSGSVTANAGTSGSGGAITIQNLGSGGIHVDPSKLSFSPAGGGVGGHLALYAGPTPSPVSSSLNVNVLNGSSTPASFGAGFISSNLVAYGPVVILPGTVSADGTGLGGGGTITIVGTTVSAGNTTSSGSVTLSANAGTMGNGGVINVGTTAFGGNINVGNANGQFVISAQGGSSFGNGGAVSLKAAQGSIFVDSSKLTVDPSLTATHGNGGSVQLAAGTASSAADMNIQVTGSLNLNGVGNGSGGTLFLIDNSSTTMTVGAGATSNGVTGTISANGGSTAGDGGIVVLSNYRRNIPGVAVSWTNPSTVSFAPSAGGGNGGTIALTDLSSDNFSPTSAVTVTIPGSLSADATGSNGSGGTIVLQAAGITFPTATNLVLSANGVGNGNGGTVVFAPSTSSAAQTIGTNPGQIDISALTGATSGNGGSIYVAAGALTVLNGSLLNVSATGNGNGGSIVLNTAGTLSLTGPFNASGAGNGTGGNIILTSALMTAPAGSLTLSALPGSSGTPGGKISVNSIGLVNGNPINLTVMATNISLSSTTSAISANYDTEGGTIAVQSPNAVTLVNNTSTGASDTVLSSSAGTQFSISSSGGLIISGPINAPNVTVATTANNGSITINSPTATIGRLNSNGSVLIQANGSGNITQLAANKAAQIIGNTVTLQSGTGNIGQFDDSNPATVIDNRIQTVANTLNLQTGAGGNIAVNNATAVTLNSSSAGNSLFVSAGGNLTTASGSTISANAITLRTNAGTNASVILNGQVGTFGATPVPGSTVSITADGVGNIVQRNNAGDTFNIEAGTVELDPTNPTFIAGPGGTPTDPTAPNPFGSIGSTTAPIRFVSNVIGVATQGPGAFLTSTNTGKTSIDASSVGTGDVGTYSLTTTGDVDFLGTLQCPTCILHVHNIDINGSIGIDDPAFATSTTIVATGSITNVNEVTQNVGIHGANVFLQAGGNIGLSGASEQDILTTGANLTISAPNGDAVFIALPYGNGLFLNPPPTNIVSATVGPNNTFQLYAEGGIVVSGPITGTKTGQTTGNTINIGMYAGFVGDVILENNITATGTSGNVSIVTDGSNNIYQFGGMITTPTLVIGGTTSGTVGLASNPIYTTASNITAGIGFSNNATVPATRNTNYYLNNTGDLNLVVTGQTGGTFQLTNKGNVSIDFTAVTNSTTTPVVGPAVVDNFTVTTTAGPNGSNITLPTPTNPGAVAAATNSIILTAGAGGSIIDNGGALSAQNITLNVSGNGNIGAVGAGAVQVSGASNGSGGTNTGTVFANAGTGGSVFLTTFGPENIGTSIVSSTTGSFNASGQSGSTLGVTGYVYAPSISISSLSGLTIASTGNLASANITITDAGNPVLVAGIVGNGAANSTVSISTTDNSNINTSGNGYILGNTVALQSVGTGSIGTSTAQRILTYSQNLTAITNGGNVFDRNATYIGSTLALGASSGAGTGTFDLVNSSNITDSGILTAGSVALTAGGNIGASATSRLTVSTANLQATSTGGSVFMLDNVAAALGNSSAAGSFMLKTNGNLSTNINTTLTAPIINLQTQLGSNGNITFNGNLGAYYSQVTLATDATATTGNGNITQPSGTLSSATLNIVSGANSTVALTNTGATNLIGASGGTVTLNSTGQFLITGPVIGNSITLGTPNTSSIYLYGNVGTASSTNVTIQATGGGYILEPTQAATVSGTNVTLNTTTGWVGQIGAPIQTATGNLTTNTTPSSTVFTEDIINNTAPTLNLVGNGSAASYFSLTNAGSINIGASASINALSTLILTATGAGSSIQQASATNTSLFSPNITLTSGSGANATIGNGTNLMLIAAAPVTSGTTAQTVNLTANAGDGVFISGYETPAGVPVNIVIAGPSSSGNGKVFQIQNIFGGGGAITVNGTITTTGSTSPSSSVIFNASGDITLNNIIRVNGTGGTVAMFSNGNIVQSFNGISIYAPSITLAAGQVPAGPSASIGSQAIPIQINSNNSAAVSLQADAQTSVFVMGVPSAQFVHSGSVTLFGINGPNTPNPAPQTFSLTSIGSITVGANAQVISQGSISLIAQGPGASMGQIDNLGTTTLFAPTINLSAGTGTGATISNITYAAATTGSSAQTVILTANAGGNITVNGTNSAAAVNVNTTLTGNMNANNFMLSTSGSLTLAANSSITAYQTAASAISLTANNGDITETTAGAYPLIAPNVTLSATGGNIGADSSHPIGIGTFTNLTASSNTNLFILNTGGFGYLTAHGSTTAITTNGSATLIGTNGGLGSFSLNAGNTVTLGTGTSIISLGTISVTAGNGIFQSDASTVATLKGGTLVLTAGAGGIGTSTNWIGVETSTGVTLTANSNGSVFIQGSASSPRSTTGLTFAGSSTAFGGSFNVTAAGNILIPASGSGSQPVIESVSAINLTANNTSGLGTTNGDIAEASGSNYILVSPSFNFQATGNVDNLHIQNFVSTSPVTLTAVSGNLASKVATVFAAGPVNLAGSSSAGSNGFTLNSTGYINFLTGSSITTPGTLTVQLAAFNSSAFPTVTSSATGDVLNSPTIVFYVNQTGTLGQIGSAAAPIKISGGSPSTTINLTAEAPYGVFFAADSPVNLVAAGANQNSATNAAGVFSLTSSGNINVNPGATVTAGNLISLKATGTGSNITQSDANTVTTLIAPNLALSATGGLGSSSNPITFGATGATAVTVGLTANAGAGSAWLNALNGSLIEGVSFTGSSSAAGAGAQFNLIASGGITLSTAAPITVLNGTVSLTAGATTDITQTSQGISIFAQSVSLTANAAPNHKGNIGTVTAPIGVNSGVAGQANVQMTAAAGTNVFLWALPTAVVTGGLNFTGANSATVGQFSATVFSGTMNLAAGATIAAPAGSISLTSNSASGSIGQTDPLTTATLQAPTVTLTAMGSGNINAGTATQTLNALSYYGGVTVQNTTSASAPVTLTAQSYGGVVSITNQSTGAVTVSNSFSGQGFTIADNSPGITFTGVLTVGLNNSFLPANSFSATESGANATVTLASNAQINVNGGSLQILNNGTGAGNITFGANSQLNTLVNLSGSSSNGNITVAIGAVPVSTIALGSVTNVTPLTAGSGVVLRGNDGSSSATPVIGPGATPNAVLYAKGRSIIFNSTSASTINLGSGVKMTADPPVPGMIAALPVQVSKLMAPSIVSSTGTATSNSPFVLNNGHAAMTVSAPVLDRGVPVSTNTLTTFTPAIGTTNSDRNGARETSGNMQVLPAPAKAFDANDIVIFDGMHKRQVSTTAIPTAVKSHLEPVSATTATTSAASAAIPELTGAVSNDSLANNAGNIINLDRGGVLFAPDHALTVKTNFGQIDIAAKAIVLAVANGNGLAVYVLHDEHRGAISFTRGSSRNELTLGQHLMLAHSSGNQGYEQVNPLPFVTHRDMHTAEVGDGLKLFRSQFSITSALGGAPLFSAMEHSNEGNDRHMIEMLLKDAAILMQLKSGSGSYQRYEATRPLFTAQK